jgi:glycosyltransferase involved in cell wall biosynthesis
MKKKILFLTHVGSPGGAEYKMMNLCEMDEYESKVLYFQNGLMDDILPKRQINSAVLPMPESMVNFKKDDGIKGVLSAIPAALSMVRTLARECKKYDAVVCISQKSFILASLAKPFMRKPIIWLMNDILSPQYFSRVVVRVIKLTAFLTADQVILNSQASLKAWTDSGANTKNVNVIYPGVNIEKIDDLCRDTQTIQSFKNKFSPDGKPIIGIFGRITEWKGQDVFLRAIAKVPNAQAIIVGEALFGEDEFKNKLMALTKDLGIENRVIFAGHLNNVQSVMAACDVVAHCSTLPEPFGLVTAEATVTGTPIIASDAGGSKEIIEHGKRGQLTAIGDHEALAKAIQFCLDNPEQAQQMAQEARSYTVKNFSTNSMKVGFLEVVKKEITL